MKQITGFGKTSFSHNFKMRDLALLIEKQLNSGQESIDNEELKQLIFDLTKGHCFYCGRKLYNVKSNSIKLIPSATIDHLIPASSLGMCVKGNIVLACDNCNQERGVQTPIDYYKKLEASNTPRLYDTLHGFESKLGKIENIYKTNYPESYYLAKNLYENKFDDFKIVLQTSKNKKQDNFIFDLLSMIQDSENGNPEKTSSSSIELLNHSNIKDSYDRLVKLNCKQNKQAIKNYKIALLEVLRLMECKGFKSIDNLSNISSVSYLRLQDNILKDSMNKIGKSNVNLVFKQIAIVLNRADADKELINELKRKHIKF